MFCDILEMINSMPSSSSSARTVLGKRKPTNRPGLEHVLERAFKSVQIQVRLRQYMSPGRVFVARFSSDDVPYLIDVVTYQCNTHLVTWDAYTGFAEFLHVSSQLSVHHAACVTKWKLEADLGEHLDLPDDVCDVISSYLPGLPLVRGRLLRFIGVRDVENKEWETPP